MDAATRANLVLGAYIILLVPAMLIGFGFARRKLFEPHHKLTMTTIAIVNWQLILIIMAPSYLSGPAQYVPQALNTSGELVTSIHLLFGLTAHLLATYLVIRMWFENRLPEWFKVKNIKRYMRTTLVLCLLTALLGLVTWAVFYHGFLAPPSSSNPAQPAATGEATLAAPAATGEATKGPAVPASTSQATKSPAQPAATGQVTKPPAQPASTAQSTSAPAHPAATTQATNAPAHPAATAQATKAPARPVATTQATSAPAHPAATVPATTAPALPAVTSQATTTLSASAQAALLIAVKPLVISADDTPGKIAYLAGVKSQSAVLIAQEQLLSAAIQVGHLE